MLSIWSMAALGEDRSALEHELRERLLHGTSERPDLRAPALLALRQALYEGFARRALPEDAVRALYALADVEQASIEPVRQLPCPTGATLEGCLSAQVGPGPVLLTGAVFTVFVPEGDRTRIVSGRLHGDVLQLEAETVRDDALLASTARLATGVHPMEPWSDSTFEKGARLDHIFLGWHADVRPLVQGDVALCTTEEGLVVSGRLQPPVRLVQEDWISGRLQVVSAQPMPCESGFVLGRELGVTPGKKQSFSMGAGSPIGERDGGQVRTWRLGEVTVTEAIPPGGRAPYQGSCELRHPGGTLNVGSAYGCSVYLAADLNADSLADFVIHTGSEGCEEDTLWMSGPEGWRAVAVSGGCC